MAQKGQNSKAKVVARNGAIGYLKGENFYPESNFIISRVICCVHLDSRRGYLVKIKGTNQESESTCFFTLEDSNAKKDFLKAINSAHGSGGYMCQLQDVPLNKYLMALTDDFKSQSRENALGKTAATCQGLNENNIWILNEDIQLDEHGNQLGLDTTNIVWLGKYTSRYNVVPQKYAADVTTPLRSESLIDVLKRLRKCSGQNFVPSFLYIASGVMLVHYSYCLDRFQQCPTPLAVGPKGTGKTTAGKVFLSLVGHGKKKLARQLSDVECLQQSSMSSFPLVYDDPDNITSIKSLINNFFNGQSKATTRAILQPKTRCMFTINTDKLSIVLHGFHRLITFYFGFLSVREASRVVMIPFPKLDQSNPLSQQVEYEEKLQRSLKYASSAVGVVVSVASKLAADDKATVTDTITRVESILGKNVHHRIIRNYTTLMLFATKLADLCPEESPEIKDLWDFFSEQIRPYVEKYQVERVASGAPKDVNTTAEVVNFVEILLGHISDMDANEARKFVNPAALCLGTLGYAVSKTKVQKLLGSDCVLASIVKAVQEGALGEGSVVREFRTEVAGEKDKQRALTFRRTIIPSQLRKRLDEVLCYQPKEKEVDEVSESREDISIVCSSNTRWLNQNEMITALGEEREGYFQVIYPLDSSLERGQEIILDGGENTTSTFPAGTKVVFPVVRPKPLDDLSDASESASSEETDDDDSVKTDRGELEKLDDGFAWYKEPSKTSRTRTAKVKSTPASVTAVIASTSGMRTSDEEKEDLDEEFASRAEGKSREVDEAISLGTNSAPVMY
ncbi:hypothetical protein ACROYT_G001882 [Oculina patagonica]